MKTLKETKIYIGLSPEEYEVLEKAGDILIKLEAKHHNISIDDKDAEVYLTKDTYQIVQRLRDSADDICYLDNDEYILSDDILDLNEVLTKGSDK